MLKGLIHDAARPDAVAGLDREALRRDLVRLGFTAVGFAPAVVPPLAAEALAAWLGAGHHGTMDWLAATARERGNVQAHYPWATTAVCFSLAYDRPEPRDQGLLPRISRYAQGRDYHNVLKRRLRRAGRVLTRYGAREWRGGTDTEPVLERVLCAQAGLGWLGKNTMLIDTHWGSYMFLAVLLTDLDIPPDAPATDHCGRCRRCLDACPTEALVAPKMLDARRCIAYLNVEHRGGFAAPYDAPLHGWLHGCDMCQEVCPFVASARQAGRSGDVAFVPAARLATATLDELAAGERATWHAVTHGSPLRRGGETRLRRIARRLQSADAGVVA